MINNSFDDEIKKRLGNYSPEVPPHIWENINSRKDKKRPLGYFQWLQGPHGKFIALIIIALIAGSIYLAYKHTGADTKLGGTNKGMLPSQKPGTTPLAPEALPAENNDLANNTKSNSTSEIPAEENKTTKAPGKTAMTASSTTASELISARQDSQTKTNKTGTTPSPLRSDAADLATKENDQKVKVIRGWGSIRSSAKLAEDKNFNMATAKKNGHRTNAKSRITIKNASTADDISTGDDPGGNTTVNKEEADVYLNKYYLNPALLETQEVIPATVRSINLAAMSIPCPGTGKKGTGNKSYVEIYGGPDYAFRSFSDTANSVYLKKRKETTQFVSAYSFGLRYTRLFENGFSFRTGINYSQVNEKFSFEQGHIIHMVAMTDDHGDTIGSYATTSTRYKTTHNKYRTIDIPLLLGYEVGVGRLHTNLNAGFIVNAYSWQKGDILDSAYQPVNITTGKANSPYNFKSNIGIGFTGAVSFYYKLSGNMQLLAEPYIRYNLSAANKADITLKQKFTTTGLRLGVRIDF